MTKRKLLATTMIASMALAATVLGAFAATVGNFVIPPDVPSRYASQIRPAPSYVDAMVLAAGVAEAWTAPANTRFVVFASNCNFYAKPNATAAVPATEVTDGTGSELNPTAWYSSTPFTTIGFIAPTACIITIAPYLGPVR